jgi:hypothetical protein
MKARVRTPQVLIEAPPDELRMFSDPSQRHARGLGMDVYPDRAAWLAAREAWAAERGMTVRQWWEGFVDELVEHAQSLDEMNLPFSREYHVEEDDWEDPRLVGLVLSPDGGYVRAAEPAP